MNGFVAMVLRNGHIYNIKVQPSQISVTSVSSS